jgi:hypothetical protein
MIQERDVRAAAQARLLDERWSAMQDMERMIQERDATVAAQARLLDERWAAMQAMERLIRDHSRAPESPRGSRPG